MLKILLFLPKDSSILIRNWTTLNLQNNSILEREGIKDLLQVMHDANGEEMLEKLQKC